MTDEAIAIEHLSIESDEDMLDLMLLAGGPRDGYVELLDPRQPWPPVEDGQRKLRCIVADHKRVGPALGPDVTVEHQVGDIVQKDDAGRLAFVRKGSLLGFDLTWPGGAKVTIDLAAIRRRRIEEQRDRLAAVDLYVRGLDVDDDQGVPTFWHNGPGHFLLWALRRWPRAAEFVHNRTEPTKARRGGSGSGG